MFNDPFFFLCCHLLLILLLPDLLLSGSAASRSTVEWLPGFPGRLPFQLETGYVGVDDEDDVQLFYYFVKSERNPEEDPLVFWLTGGPRCSGLSAVAFEIGPLYFESGGNIDDGGLPTLKLNLNSWTKIANIIFVDAPVGTGFSYSKTAQNPKIGDTKSAKDSFGFLRKWLIEHPEFLSNPLYVCGDSYSGIIIPNLVQQIIDDIEAGGNPLLNFKGYLIGNPVTDTKLEHSARVPFSRGMGLISHELYESMVQNCGGEFPNFHMVSAECSNNWEAFNRSVSRINDGHILEPYCASRKLDDRAQERSLANYEQFIFPQFLASVRCRSYGYSLATLWANNDGVRKALHIQKGSIGEWIRCNYDLPYEREIKTSLEYHKNLSHRGYRSLIYSGDHDMVVSHISTEYWIRLLNLSIIDDWYPWLVDGQIAGYTRTFSNGMIYATVKGGGHTAPEYTPKECFAMFKRWISHNPL